MKTKTKQGTNQNKKPNLKKDGKKEKAEKNKEEENKTLNDEKDKKQKKTAVKMNKCEFCQNPIPDPKKTLNFSCQHQLCGVCISHSIFRDNFKCIMERNNLITLVCNECINRNSSKPGMAQTQMSFILSLLKDTYKIRNKRQKDICLTHKLEANYCSECRKWICEECKKTFHDANFPNHSSYSTEEPFSFKRCSKHGDRGLELFCDDCGIDICSACALKGGEHSTHNVISMVDYKKRIVKEKKKFKYQNMDEFDEALKNMQIEFKNQYEEMYKKKSDLISEITTLLQNFYDKFFSYKEKMEIFIENYFKIIRACYFNYFKDIEEKEPRMNSLEFIKSVDKEISHFDFDSKYTDELEKIKEQLELIVPRKFFEYKLRFLNHSFKCINTMKDIKIEESKEQKNHLKQTKEIKNQIYCLLQLKNGNVLTGGSRGIMNIWDTNSGKKIDSFQAHKGNIYSVAELSDGRLASSSSDSWIKIWDKKDESDTNINFEPKIVDIVPKKSIKKIINVPQVNILEQNIKNDDNNNINTGTNNNNINSNIFNDVNTNEINTTSGVPIKKDNEKINLNATNFNQLNLNSVPKNIIVPGKENLGINSGINATNNINSGLSNEPQIKLDQNAPDTGYGGNGVHHDYPKNVGYGNSGTSQNNNLGSQPYYNFNQNTSSNNQNEGSSIMNQSQNNLNNDNHNNININTNLFPQNSGFNPNPINNINNDNNNKEKSNLMLDNNESNKNDNIINKDSSSISTQQFRNIVQGNTDYMDNNNKNNNINNNNINNNNLSSNGEPKPEEPKKEETKIVEPKKEEPKIEESIKESIKEQPKLEESKKEEEKKEESKKEEEKKDANESKYDDFDFDGIKDSSLKANPPKRPDLIDIDTSVEKSNYICKMELHGHPEDVNCIFETSQNRLISCGKDGYILIWSLENPEKPIKMYGHQNGVGCGVVLKDNYIITGGGDCKIKIWDLGISDIQKPDIILKGHKNAIFSICVINEKKIGSASCDKSVRIWDLNYNACTLIFEGHSGFIWSIINLKVHTKNTKAQDSKEEIKNLIVSASSDKTIKFWDLEDKRCIKTIFAHDKEITCLGKLKDGNIISGSLDASIKVWKL